MPYQSILLTLTTIALSIQLSMAAVIRNDTLQVKLAAPTQVLKDTERQLSLDQVIHASSWKEISERHDTYPRFNSSAFWSRSYLTSTSEKHDKWLLTIQSSRWEEIDWYIVRESGKVEHYSDGNARSKVARAIPSILPNILLSLAPGENVTVYLRCQSRARGSLNVSITDITNSENRNIEGTFLLTFGALGCTLLMGLIISIYGNHKGSIPYCISILCCILFYASLTGYIKSMGWPFSHFLSMQGSYLIILLSLITQLYYISAFFDLQNATGWPKLICRILIIISVSSLPLSLVISYSLFNYFINFYTTIQSIFTVSVAIWAWRQGMTYAKFYVIVWPILWASLILDTLCGEGLLDLSVNQEHIVTLGLVIFQFGVFLVLAERTRAKFHQHKLAQKQLLDKEQALVTDLEKKVASRTSSLQKATIEAIKANKFKDLFLANIGHDIRTPLTALIGLSNILAKKGESINLSSDFRHLLSQIQIGGSHLNLMLTNLMDISSSNHGKIPLSVAPIYLVNWSQSLKGILQPLASAQGLTLQWSDNFKSSETFTSDEIRLSQILINLVHNAIKFSPEKKTVYVNLYQKEGRLTLEIIDEGPGLPDNPEQLFTSFLKNHTTLSNNKHGAGLGLHIVKTALDLINGKIKATTRPEGGALFYVTISPPVDI